MAILESPVPGDTKREKHEEVRTVFAGIDKRRHLAIFSIYKTTYITRTKTVTKTITSWYKILSHIITKLTVIYTLNSPIQTKIVEVINTRYVDKIETVFLGTGVKPPTEAIKHEKEIVGRTVEVVKPKPVETVEKERTGRGRTTISLV